MKINVNLNVAYDPCDRKATKRQKELEIKEMLASLIEDSGVYGSSMIEIKKVGKVTL